MMKFKRFSLKYELTVKRTEMRKLEEITTAEEQRIEKAEKDLEEDAVRFFYIIRNVLQLENVFFVLAYV